MSGDHEDVAGEIIDQYLRFLRRRGRVRIWRAYPPSSVAS